MMFKKKQNAAVSILTFMLICSLAGSMTFDVYGSENKSRTGSAAATPTPDPNDPDSPDLLKMGDEDTASVYVRVWDPEKEEWTYMRDRRVSRALPDPNDDDSPAKMTILDDEDVPRTYIRVPEGEGFVYILDDNVPMEVPKTADAAMTILWAGMCLASVEGVIALRPRRRNKRRKVHRKR